MKEAQQLPISLIDPKANMEVRLIAGITPFSSILSYQPNSRTKTNQPDNAAFSGSIRTIKLGMVAPLTLGLDMV